MLEVGLTEVTMIQRSKTFIVLVEYYKVVADVFYRADLPTDLADKLNSHNLSLL